MTGQDVAEERQECQEDLFQRPISAYVLGSNHGRATAWLVGSENLLAKAPIA